MTAAKVTSSYEIERNKPMPNRIHGVLQGDISFLLNLQYRKKYEFSSEVSLATTPSSTPDICIYPKRKLAVNRRATERTIAEMMLLETEKKKWRVVPETTIRSNSKK